MVGVVAVFESTADVPSKDGSLVLRVVPAEDEWGWRNDKWRTDVFELEQVLLANVPEAVRRPTPDEAHKGLDLLAVIVALGSAGAFTAAVEAFKAWLGKKPDRRSIVVEYQVGDEIGRITVDATNVDSGDLAEIASKAFRAPT